MARHGRQVKAGINEAGMNDAAASIDRMACFKARQDLAFATAGKGSAVLNDDGSRTSAGPTAISWE